MLELLSDSQLREHCKARIENLELWLRRLINHTLSEAYGDYFEGTFQDGSNIIKRSIVDSLNKRLERNPSRYPRKIDALLLEDLIAIICNPVLYRQHFCIIFNGNDFFLDGAHLRYTLNRLVPLRNKLSHANALSLRDYEIVLCGTGDVITAMKTHYSNASTNNEYNVPLILQFGDSWGAVFHREQLGDAGDGTRYCDYSGKSEFFLRPGDVVKLTVTVDPSFDPNSYAIKWTCNSLLPTGNSPTFVQVIDLCHVGLKCFITCDIVSNQLWHRLPIGCDDRLFLIFKVLPPL